MPGILGEALLSLNLVEVSFESFPEGEATDAAVVKNTYWKWWLAQDSHSSLQKHPEC